MGSMKWMVYACLGALLILSILSCWRMTKNASSNWKASWITVPKGSNGSTHGNGQSFDLEEDETANTTVPSVFGSESLTGAVSTTVESGTSSVLEMTTTGKPNYTHTETTPTDIKNTAKDRPATNQSITIPIVVQLSGELGNNLSKLASGLCLQHWLLDDFGVSSRLLLRHQPHPKWQKGYRNAIQCFPGTRQYNFDAANTPAMDAFLQTTASKLAWWEPMSGVNSGDSARITQALDSVLQYYRQSIAENPTAIGARALPLLTNAEGTNLTLPFIYSNSFAGLDPCMDRYHDAIATTLTFNETACCGEQKPYPGESVFHFRNFLGEMPRVGKRLGYEEINPHDMAHLVFSHLPTTLNGAPNMSQVAITARATDASAAAPYIQALAERNISARVITSNSDVHDFCFLQRAPVELVGTAVSTFAQWAGFLGQTPKVRLYIINSTRTRERSPSWFSYHSYNFTFSSNLRQRFVFEFYEQD